MSKYEAWHPLEAERVTKAMRSRDLEAVIIGADGTRKPFGQFTKADLQYWMRFMADRVRLMTMAAELGEWAATQLEAGDWETLGDAAPEVLAEARRREQAVITEMERLGPITDDIIRDGHLLMKIPDIAEPQPFIP